MAFLRSTAAFRRYASTFAEHYRAEEIQSRKTAALWKKISIFVAAPALVLTTYSTYSKEKEHWAHIEEHGRPPFIAYSHLRIRTKPFPWGDGNHSLIHNKRTNPLPEGYEDE